MSRRRSCGTKLGGAALTNLIALILVYALFGNSVLQAGSGVSAGVGSSQKETTNKPTLQERILEVPQGTIIEVRLMNKQKVRGKLGEISNEGFSLQTAQGSKIETQKIAFAEVKSFKQAGGGTGKGIGRGVIYGLAGIGVLVLVMVIWAASRPD